MGYGDKNNFKILPIPPSAKVEGGYFCYLISGERGEKIVLWAGGRNGWRDVRRRRANPYSGRGACKDRASLATANSGPNKC